MTIADTPGLSDDILHAPMPLRQLGGTGWEISALTLGGVKWDFKLSEADAVALIRRAVELGVNAIDTAAAYSDGESERRLGIAIEDCRDRLWINTKSSKRDYDGAKRDIERSLKLLRTDRIDLFFIHGLDDMDDYTKITGSDSVLKAIDEFRAAGHIRHVGVSGHWYKDTMTHMLSEIDLDAVLVPCGIFNEAYGYSYFEKVVPLARAKGCAVLGMKVFGAGRVMHARSVEPYLRFSLNADIDTTVIGCDSIAQLEQTVSIVKRQPTGLSDAELTPLLDEARAVTQDFDKGEFAWVSHYK